MKNENYCLVEVLRYWRRRSHVLGLFVFGLFSSGYILN